MPKGLSSLRALAADPTRAYSVARVSHRFEKVESDHSQRPRDPKKVRFVLVSDTHSKHGAMEHPIPPGDVLVHAGDLTKTGRAGEVQAVAAWLRSQRKS